MKLIVVIKAHLSQIRIFETINKSLLREDKLMPEMH